MESMLGKKANFSPIDLNSMIQAYFPQKNHPTGKR